MQTPVRELGRILGRLMTPVPATGLAPDELLRFKHFTVFILLGVPTMVVFGLVNLNRGVLPLTGLIAASAAGLTTGWLYFRRTGRWRLVYRVNIVLFAGLALYMLAKGGDGGSKCVWTFTLPLIALFNLGHVEGFLWSAASFAVATALIVAAGSVDWIYPYPSDFKVRFITAYAIVSALAVWFEHSRNSYRAAMAREHERLEREVEERRSAEQQREALILELQGALDEVSALRGLLPICAHCHRIRDDQGAWNRMEKFIQERSGAKFSHSICPQCATRHYPDEAL